MANIIRASKLAKKLNIDIPELSSAFAVELSPNQKIAIIDNDAHVRGSAITPGDVIAIEDHVVISEDYTVYINGIPSGTVRHNLTWFAITPNPLPSEINKIVFIDDYVWGYKQMSSRIEEFKTLSERDKCKVLALIN